LLVNSHCIFALSIFKENQKDYHFENGMKLVIWSWFNWKPPVRPTELCTV